MDEGSAGNNKQYGNIAAPSWGFDALSNKDDHADSDAEMLLDRCDNDSTVAEQDTDREDNWNDVDEFAFGSLDQAFQDDHAMYSTARDSGALHLEDTNMMSDDPPPVDINLSDNPHDKMD